MEKKKVGGSSGAEMIVCHKCGRVNLPRESAVRMPVVRCGGCGQSLSRASEGKQIVGCPNCEAALELDPDWQGVEIECPTCLGKFVLETEVEEVPLPARIEHVSRPQSTRLPGSKRGRGKKLPGRRKKRKVPLMRRLPWRFILGGVAVFALVIGVILEVGRREGVWLRSAPSPAAAGRGGTGAVERPVEEVKQERFQRIFREEREKLGEVLNGFVEAYDPAEFRGLVRFESDVRRRMERLGEYRRRGGFELRGWDVADWRMEGGADGRLMLLLELSGTRDGVETRRKVVIERPEAERFLVDWDSYVRYGDMEWDVFVLEEPEEAQRFQVYIRRFDGAHPAFPLEDYYCFQAFWDNPDDGVAFFVPRESEEYELLLEHTLPGRLEWPLLDTASPPMGAGAATLNLRFDPSLRVEGYRRPAVFEGLVHIGWVDPRPSDGVAVDGAPAGWREVGTELQGPE